MNQCDTNCSSCDCIIHSVALEEAAIARILHIEGEKIQKALELSCDAKELICLNRSVTDTISEITRLEMTLFDKLKKACDSACDAQCCGALAVHVFFCENCEPISCANVCIFDEKDQLVASGQTDCHGNVVFSGLERGEFAVKITLCGKEKVECVKIECCSVATLNVCFSKKCDECSEECHCSSGMGDDCDCWSDGGQSAPVFNNYVRTNGNRCRFEVSWRMRPCETRMVNFLVD